MADKNGDQGEDKISFVCLDRTVGLSRKRLQLGVSCVVVNVAHVPFSSFVRWRTLSILCGGLGLFWPFRLPKLYKDRAFEAIFASTNVGKCSNK
jgi:hypothetical protein